MKRWLLSLIRHGDSLSRTDYERLPALKCTVAYNRYGGYCVPESSRSRPAALKILAGQVYEPETLKFMREHCGDGDVVHAGTYFGDFLPALSSALAPGSTLWAFEPNPENCRCARITRELNGLDNVVLTHAGLGARKEELRIRTTDSRGQALGGGSSIVASDAAAAGTEPVQIVAVDEVVAPERTVSIIQLDVEGHEREALTGALETIRRCRPLIILEVLPGSDLLDSPWFAETIRSLGYEPVREMHGNTVFAPAAGG